MAYEIVPIQGGYNVRKVNETGPHEYYSRRPLSLPQATALMRQLENKRGYAARG